MGLFTQYVQREIAWAFPMLFDQVQYLTEAYDTYDTMLTKGLARGLWYGLELPIPQGALIHLEGALAFLVLGRSRWAALSVNFAHYALFQCALAGLVAWRTRSSAAALVAVGLLLAVYTPFYRAGGLSDFRLDFIAWNIFGIFICAVLRSRGFLSLRWSIAAGAVAGWLGVFRFITVAYLCGIFALTAVALSAAQLRRTRRLQLTPRLRGLLWSATVFVAITAPFLVWKWAAIRKYYVVGQTGEQALRREGVATLWDTLSFYPASAWNTHGGKPFVWAGAAALAACALLAWRWGQRRPRRAWFDGAGCFLAACGLSPFIILTLNPAKSPVVGHVLVLPLLFVFVVSVVFLVRRLPGAGPARWLLRGLAAVILSAGLVQQVAALGARGPLHGLRRDVEDVHRLHDTLLAYSRLAGWDSFSFSADFISETVPTVTVSLYERHGVRLAAYSLLGNRIYGVDRPTALSLLRGSDFVVLTQHDAGTIYNYPLDESGRDLAPALQEFVRRNMFPLGEFRVYDRHLTLYARPGLHTDGNDGGWITSRGFTIETPGVVVRARPNLRLVGRAPMTLLRGVLPGVRATLTLRGQSAVEVPAHIANLQDTYCIGVDVPAELTPALRDMEAARIHLAFEGGFVPREIGLNEDTRHLVLVAPDSVQFVQSPARCTPQAAPEKEPPGGP